MRKGSPLKNLAALIILGLTLFLPGQAEALKGRLNINTATAGDLEKLPFIGKNRAHDIIGLRQRQGYFSKPEDLLAAGSIGPLTLAAITPYIKFKGANDLEKTKNGLDSRKTVITRPGQVMLLADREFFPVLFSLINSAHHSVDVGMYLFKTGKASRGKTARLLREMARARDRGAMVRVMLEQSDYNDNLNRENRETAARLRRSGIKVVFDRPRTTTHVKAVVIDRRFTLLGSHNLTNSALGRNHELSLMIDDPTLAGQVSDYLDTVFSR